MRWNIYLKALTNQSRTWNHLYLSQPYIRSVFPPLHTWDSCKPIKKTCAEDTQKLFKLYFSYTTFTLLFKIQGHKHTENVKYYGSICTRELFESCCCTKKEPERGCVSLCTHNCFWRRDSQHWIKCIERDTEIYLNTKICIQQWCYYHCTLSDEML